MAEAMFATRYAGHVETFSAGVEPWPALHPMAVKLMVEQGVDMAGRYPKHARIFAEAPLDVVVTIGDRARAEAGPFRARPLRLHWDIPDPAEADGTPDSEWVFRRACQAIQDRFPELLRILARLAEGHVPDPGFA